MWEFNWEIELFTVKSDIKEKRIKKEDYILRLLSILNHLICLNKTEPR
jgi:hypothetical protein